MMLTPARTREKVSTASGEISTTFWDTGHDATGMKSTCRG